MVYTRRILIYQKGESESVNRRRTDNTMAKENGTRGQTTIYKTLHRKLKIERYWLSDNHPIRLNANNKNTGVVQMTL